MKFPNKYPSIKNIEKPLSKQQNQSRINTQEHLQELSHTKNLIKEAFEGQYLELRDRKKQSVYYEKGVIFAAKTAKLPKVVSQVLFDLKSAFLFIKGDMDKHNAFIKGYTDTIK